MADSRKIHQLHGPMIPAAFLGQLLEDAEEIEFMAVVVKWKGHMAPTNVYWTQMTAGDGAWVDYVFRNDFMPMLMGEKERT